MGSVIMGSAGHVGPMFMERQPKGSFPSVAPATGVARHGKAVGRGHCLSHVIFAVSPLSSVFGSSLQQPVTAAYTCTKQLVRNTWSKLFFSLPPHEK